MRNTPNAAWHKQREDQFLDHIQHLLVDPKFVVDTAVGQRSVISLNRQTTLGDKSIDLKRVMSQKRPDRALEMRMPVGRTLTTTFSVKKWFFFQNVIGRLAVVVVPPTNDLLADANCEPMSAGNVRRQLAALPPSLPGVPTTVMLVSTAGFEFDARELAERTSERTIILVEPNPAGGWTAHGSTEIHGILDLLDPESADGKRQRVDAAIEKLHDKLLGGSLSAEQLAVETELPLMTVEDAVKSHAKRTPGLVAKRLDGRMLLFREGTAPQGKAVGGEGMSLTDRIKLLFNRKGDVERKIAFLSERRAALTQQRDTSHEEMFRLEKQESALRLEFKSNEAVNARKRITSQLVQLRKEIERRQQLLQVVNQQVNVVSTHLHNLELLGQGRAAKLPDSDEIATDAAAAEDMLARLQADSEVADSVSAVSMAGLSDEEQSLYEELTRDSAPAASVAPSSQKDDSSSAKPQATPPGAASVRKPLQEPG